MPRRPAAAASNGRKPESWATATSLAQRIANAVASGTFFYSFEYSPARDPNLEDLIQRVTRMHESLRPLWVDVTWGFGDVGSKSIEACRQIQKRLNLPVLMHLICTDMTVSDLDASLDAALLAGVRSILVLRGYTQGGYDHWQSIEGGFDHADTLCTHIRRRHGDYFSIGVAGFPATHPESRPDLSVPPTDAERDEDVRRIKGKVDAGADFIICQFTFQLAEWTDFVQRCRRCGITVPLLPGVQPLTEYATAKMLASSWAVPLPDDFAKELRACAHIGDSEAAFDCGLAFVAALADSILHFSAGCGEGLGLHFFVYDGERETRALLEVLETEYGWRRGSAAPGRH